MLFEALEQIIDPEPHGAAFNMALDETLLRGLEPALPAIRIYRWKRPAVSFGYFEKYEAVEEGLQGREAVRKVDGRRRGRARAGRDVFSVRAGRLGFGAVKAGGILPARARGDPRSAGEGGNRRARRGGKRRRGSSACFENPVRHDILIDSRKIAGAAQRRTKRGLLHQGSIQNVNLPQGFEKLLTRAFSGEIRERELTREECEAAAAVAVEKYASDAWTRRF